LTGLLFAKAHQGLQKSYMVICCLQCLPWVKWWPRRQGGLS